MGFYTVWVRSLQYHGHEALTYSSDQKLLPGSIVSVPLQHQVVLGYIDQEVKAPTFATKAISQVYDLPSLPAQLLSIAEWLHSFYATNLGVVASLLLPAVISAKKIEEINIIVVNDTIETPETSLTEEQKAVVEVITEPNTYLLHGRTGSGKTRVYIELAIRAIEAGKSVLLLTPEISLTSQLAQSFQTSFGKRVVIIHSQLTPAERQRVWLQILSASPVYPLIVIGPRSALFSPLANVGLIVLDEAHEPAYKQEQAPYYHARTVASQLAHLYGAKLIIGTATPSINDYFLAKELHKPILRLKKIAKLPADWKPTEIKIVDLKDRTQFTRSPQLSQPLIEAIQTALGQREQSLVYLNRRGTARVVLCENCGWQPLCPHCDLPLIYHADGGSFRCHTCGHREPMHTSCPVCHHPSILFKTFGTKAVADEIQKLFPGAVVMRFDTDNIKSERFERQYDTVKHGGVDILVGTQLLAKGLDLPELSTVGILQADSSLSVPDFSTKERTYQLISQVLGRVGRGHTQGHAIIQTYHPESPILLSAVRDDYDDFYKTELAERHAYHFPPYYYLLKLSTLRASYRSAENAATKFKERIMANIAAIEVDGPVPAFYEKARGKYQVQLIVRSKQRSRLLEVIKLLPSGWAHNIDPLNLL